MALAGEGGGGRGTERGLQRGGGGGPRGRESHRDVHEQEPAAEVRRGLHRGWGRFPARTPTLPCPCQPPTYPCQPHATPDSPLVLTQPPTLPCPVSAPCNPRVSPWPCTDPNSPPPLSAPDSPLSAPPGPALTPSRAGPRRTLADIIMEKITEKQTEVDTALSELSGCPMPQLDPRVLEVYRGVREVRPEPLNPQPPP